MDRQFLEFWGNFLINAARGQQQMEDIFSWMNQGYKGFANISDMFKNAYGLFNLTEKNAEYVSAWENAFGKFQESFNAYMEMMGMVPRAQHLQLVGKYESLKEKCDAQEETIKHLRMLVNEKGSDSEVVKSFDDLIHVQGEQFQKLMNEFQRIYGKEDKRTSNKKKQKE